MARADGAMKGPIQKEMKNYRARLLPFMPGRGAAEKERAYLSIFSTMIGAVAIARICPEASQRKKVLATARDFLLRSF
jgi:TetR/AcrR family transcriptional repressor of nem operon